MYLSEIFIFYFTDVGNESKGIQNRDLTSALCQKGGENVVLLVKTEKILKTAVNPNYMPACGYEFKNHISYCFRKSITLIFISNEYIVFQLCCVCNYDKPNVNVKKKI
jgi:hypothetical protein